MDVPIQKLVRLQLKLHQLPKQHNEFNKDQITFIKNINTYTHNNINKNSHNDNNNIYINYLLIYI